MEKLLKIPEHVAIIMDGNGRWAKEKNFSVSKGHTEGTKRIEDVLELAIEVGIKVVTIYAFSTENWKRQEMEINHLMQLVKLFYNNKINKMAKNGIKIKVIGEEENIPKDIQKIFDKMQNKTKDNEKLILNIAFNYGGQSEIITTVNNFIQQNPGKEITIQDFNNTLYTSPNSKVDLLIRTSGEQRISNFLLWQIAYAEFVFTDVYWPDFTKEEFKNCLLTYQKRDRRYGGR